MKKKLLTIFIASLMLLMGCGTVNNTSGDETSETKETSDITLTVESNILGLADTGNKTSLKQDLIYTSGPGDINLYYYNEDGERVIYENEEELTIALDPVRYQGQAIFSLGDVDDSLIDSSEAVVELLDGNSYSAVEFIFSATSLDGAWENGTYTYTLNEGDIEWNTWDYDTTPDYNSTREWSIMGGDGNGVYNFRLQVSGIKYDGKEIEPVVFPAFVYIYGRSAADLAISYEFIENTYDESYTSDVSPSDETQWIWTTENKQSGNDNKPYLNDEYTDYISVVWPDGSDASDISADDVTITLKSKYDDTYVLSTETEYGEHEYAVVSNENETEIFITYQQWAYVPVYSTMEIEVSNGTLSATNTYDICSVAAYMVQTGGGGVTVDHTVTCYNYYGLSDMTIDNAANTTYSLSVEMDGAKYWYAEDENGEGYLSKGIETEGFGGMVSYSAPEDAAYYDGTEIFNIAVSHNVVFAETRVGVEEYEDKTVDGDVITFTREKSVTKQISQIVEDGAKLKDGFNLTSAGTSQWSWTMRYQSGWTTFDSEPTSTPYIGYYGYGYEPGSINPSYETILSQQKDEPKPFD